LRRSAFIAIISISILAIFLMIPMNKSFSWSCAQSLEPKELFKRYDSIFIGKVIQLSNENVGNLNPKSRVTFEVKSSLKGNDRDNLTIVTTAGSVFIEGKDYLVYAYKTTMKNYLYKYEEGELATDTMCGGTKELSLANYDLKQIDEAKDSNVIIDLIIAFFVSFVIITLLLIIKRRRN
jgi:hypothetical protein